MSHDFAAALCLVLVIEGLVLFAMPSGWQRMIEHLRELEPRQLRVAGGVMIAVGILALRWVN